MIKLRGVTLRHGSVVALDTIDLDIPSGCTVGIIGPDGVGKSTLLSLISGSHAIQKRERGAVRRKHGR